VTILDAFRRSESRANLENPGIPLTATSLINWMSGPPVEAGVVVSEKSSLGMAAVWRAVNLIAGTCASLPLHAYTQTDDGVRTSVPSGQAGPRLLAKPHPDLTPYELWEVEFVHALLWGNAYLQTLRNEAGQIAELWPVHPSRVKAGRARDTTKMYVVDGNEENPFTDREILHIPGLGYDGIRGLSPIQCARQGIGLSMAAERYGAKLFGSGSLASGLLTTDASLTEPQATALKERWAQKTSGLQNAHEVAVLDNGAKFQQLTIPPEDAQFIESRRFQISEVARIFGVPPHMLMETDKSTSWGTGIEQQGIGFVVYTLRPWLTRFEQRISRILTPTATFASFTVEGLLRGDSTQRAAFYTSMWNIGAYSTNDIRRLENQPPVDGGDIRYRPLNMGELGQPDPAASPAIPADEPTTEGAPA
jgi:HK97 family phage portal protein